MILNKRLFRELKGRAFSYLALFLIVVLAVGVVSAMAGSTDSIDETIWRNEKACHVEDGEFTVFLPLRPEQEEETERQGVALERQFYVDIPLDGANVRIFKVRESINTIAVTEGETAVSEDQAVIEQKFAEAGSYHLQDTVTLAGKAYTVCGTGCVPDYSYTLENTMDLGNDNTKFGLIFVSEDAFDRIAADSGERVNFQYAWRITDKETDNEDLKDWLTDTQGANLTGFLPNEDNKRIHAAEDDASITKISALFSGIIVFFLIAFMFSVFAAHNIEENRKIIGTLYALGYRRSELTRHFIILPVAVVLAGSLVGLIVGYFLTSLFAAGNVDLYSYPPLQIVLKPYLYAYGLLMPNLITIFVNGLVLSRKLSQKPLSLIRNEQPEEKTTGISLDRFSYITSFRIRHFLKEKVTTLIMFAGMTIAVLLMVWGFSIYGGVLEYAENIEKDVPFEYMYLLAAPVGDAPTESEPASVLSVETDFDLIDSRMEATLMGVKGDSEYYAFADRLPEDPDSVVISDAASKKFGYQVGDRIRLTDKLTEETYELTVTDMVEYSNGLYFFMNLDSMRSLLDQDSGYYNALLTDKTLDLDRNMVLSCISRSDIADVGQLLLDNLMSMIRMMIAMAIVLFCCVMYLLMKKMIDRSSFSVSLLKIFGYRNGEVKKVYLSLAWVVVFLSIFAGIPFSQLVVGRIFPYTVSDVTAYMRAYLYPYMYLVIALVILVSFYIVYLLLYRKISRMSFVEVLKNRE